LHAFYFLFVKFIVKIGQLQKTICHQAHKDSMFLKIFFVSYCIGDKIINDEN